MDRASGESARVSLPPRTPPVCFATFTLDLDGCSLTKADGGEVALTRNEFALLREFIRHPGRVLSRDYLLDSLAGKRPDPFDRSIDVLVGRLRRKIELDSKQPALIVTAPGEGYKFAAQIRSSPFKPLMEEGTAARASPPVTPPRGRSIVVLPFINIGGDSEQEYFVDGVTESLTTDLSRIEDFYVIGRNTAFTYKGKQVDPRQLARDLSVRYVLKGSVQRGGDRMRVSVQLIDPESGIHLWAERFDKPLADLFEMQDEIVARLASALAMQLVAVEARRAKGASEPDSIDLCFQAQDRVNKGFTPDNLAAARRLYESALALDPSNVSALTGLAGIDLTVATVLLPDDRVARLAAAEKALHQALSRAPDNAFAHFYLGIVLTWTHRAQQGIREFERTLELERNLAEVHAQIGVAKVLLGRAEETEAHISEALRLGPRSTFVYIWCAVAGWAKLVLGDDEEAVVWLRRSIETNPNNPTSHFLLAAALACLGRLVEARVEARAGLAIAPAFTVSRFRATALDDLPEVRAARERYFDGMCKAGVPEE